MLAGLNFNHCSGLSALALTMSYDDTGNGLQRYAATPPDEKLRLQTVRALGLPASASNNRVLQSLCETLAELLSVPIAGTADSPHTVKSTRAR